MAELISSVAYATVVLTFVAHLILDRRFRQKQRSLERQHYRLRQRLEAMQRQDNWVVSNSAFSHAPWALICLSGQYYRTAGRHFRKEDLEAYQTLLTGSVAKSGSHSVYRGCFDLCGFFGEVGSFGSLKDLSDDGCKLLKLSFPLHVDNQFTESPPVIDPAISPVVCEPEVAVITEPGLEAVRPVVVRPFLPALFSSRFR